MAGQDFQVVVAIDIGSAFSGYAYKFRTEDKKDYTKTIICPIWENNSNMACGKTASSLLLNPDGTFNSFGFNAEDVYTEMCRKFIARKFHNDKFPDKEPKDWFLFRNFKMELYDKEIMKKGVKIKDTTGKPFSLRTVFKESISFFKKHALDAITRKTTVLSSDVLWVLTIPAIWSEPAKQFMRTAAEEAGIPAESLILALEPEAAALFTKQQELIRQSKEGKVNLVPFVPKSKFMVVDLGGGTGDITVHEVQEDHTLHEINMATGGAWGGNRINEAFLGIWKDILQNEFLECSKQYPDEILELQQNFERQKRSIGEETQKQHLYIPLPECLREVDDIKRKLEGSTKYSGIRYERGKVEFPLQMIEDLFKEPIRDITSQISKLMKNNAVDAIILVGGFSESTFVYKSIKDSFESSVIVLSPPECGLSVLKGAVLYGFHPEQISKRVSRYSYGFSVSKPFDPVLHDSERDRYHKHYDQLEDVFLPIVRAGDSVLPYEVREYKCRPAKLCPNFALVEFYATLDKSPKYVNDHECFTPEFPCKHIGDIKLECGNKTNLENNEINVQVVFGFTQLNVSAECTIAGKKKQVNAHFELLK